MVEREEAAAKYITKNFGKNFGKKVRLGQDISPSSRPGPAPEWRRYARLPNLSPQLESPQVLGRRTW